MTERKYSTNTLDNIAYRLDSGESTKVELARRYRTTPRAITRLVNDYWERWHNYIGLERESDLSPEQTQEFEAMKKVVARLDKKEADRLKPLRDAITRKHKDNLRQIRKIILGLERTALSG